MKKIAVGLICFILSGFLFSTTVFAAKFTLEWDANKEVGLKGYKVYQGNSAGSYTNNYDVGNVLTHALILPEGEYFFAITAYDDNGTESGYSKEVTNGITIDNGTADTNSSGSWLVSNGANPYGQDSLYSSNAGDTYTYTISSVNTVGIENFSIDLYIYYTYWTNRCSDVDINIYDGDALLETVNIDQLVNSAQWNLLGKGYKFPSGTAKVIINSSGASGCTTSADAIKLVISSPTTTAILAPPTNVSLVWVFE
ncbi:MAG: hypothetical protein GY774_16595 [Planctomycetes bacterium]|nr:hypothetical protein [Planctomycetota bacterium]